MPTQNLTTAFNPQIWSKRVLTRLDQINVGLSCGAVNRDYEGDIKQQGDTVHVRTYGNVAIAPYRRGDPINYTALAPSKEPLTINDASYWAIQVDDLDDVQNDLRALDGYTGRAAIAINETIDAKVLGYYASAAAANQVTSSGSPYTLSASNAYTLLVDAAKRLDSQNVGTKGRWAIVGPNYKSFLLKDTTYFIRATDMGDAVIRTGFNKTARASETENFLGQCAGFNLFLSNANPTDASGAYCQFGAPGVISYAGQLRKIERIRRESTFADAVRGLLLHDATVFAEHAKGLGYIYVDAA